MSQTLGITSECLDETEGLLQLVFMYVIEERDVLPVVMRLNRLC